jgi:hypothetical protein
MPQNLSKLFLIAFAVQLSVDSAFARQTETLYVKIDYFKPAPENMTAYEQLEREIWKPLHEERYNRGIIKSWNFYQVVAGEPDVPYRYVAVNVFDDFGMIDYFDLEDIMKSVYPDKNPDELMKKTHTSREVVRTEIWEINGKIIPESASRAHGNYLTINYFDARGGSGEHVEKELDFWGRIHETRIERDILNSWAMYTLLYPGGDARHYTYSTIDYYGALSDLREPVGQALAHIAHPDLSDDEISDYFSRTGESRTLYKTELWKRLETFGNITGY